MPADSKQVMMYSVGANTSNRHELCIYHLVRAVIELN
jgi:hypothetical protein